MKAIGIDIGTTSISAVVVDTDLEQTVEALTIQSESFIDTGRVDDRMQDVQKILSKAAAALDELLDRHPDAAAIGLTGQMHGIVYVDQAGQAVSPLYTWQDQRGTLPVFGELSVVDYVKQQFDLDVFTGYGLVTHIYEQYQGNVPPSAVTLCTVPDYLGMVLTGRTAPLMHSSMAASLGFFDAESRGFKKDVLSELKIDLSMLPEVTDDFSVIGTYRGLPVTAAIGDNQASFIGSAGLEEGTVLLNVGTGGQISVLSGQHFTAPGIEARPITKDRYLLAGSSLCAGRGYAILEKFFRMYAVAAGLPDEPQYGTMAKLAAMDQGGDILQVVTTFNGTRVNPEELGSISQISENNFTPGSLTVGVLTGIARELYDMYAVISRGTGVQVKRLIASGNGVRKNVLLQQIFEEMFGTKLELSRYTEEAACGAAMCGLIQE